MKRVFIITEAKRYHPKRIGGGESYMRRLLSACKKQECYIKMILIDPNGSESVEEFDDHVMVRCANEAKEIVTSQDAHVILFNLDFKNKLKFIFIKNLYLLTLFHPATKKVIIFRVIERFLFNYQAIIVPSQRMLRYYKKFCFNAVLIPPIVPDNFHYDSMNEYNEIGFIGRLDPRKGANNVIKFIENNRAHDYNVSYIKHDHDPGIRALEKRLLNVCPGARLVEFEKYSPKVDMELVESLRRSKMFVQFYTSLDSTVDLPLLLLEALACGCMVVTNIKFEEFEDERLLVVANSNAHTLNAERGFFLSPSKLDRKRSADIIHLRFNEDAVFRKFSAIFDA